MSQKIAQLFKSIQSRDQIYGLESRILARICREAEKQARRWQKLAQLGFVISAVSLVAGLFLAGTSVVNSDFWSILSLVFSDAKIVLVHWQEFGYSLLETLPAASIVLLVAPLIIFTFSLWLKHLAKDDYHRRCAIA